MARQEVIVLLLTLSVATLGLLAARSFTTRGMDADARDARSGQQWLSSKYESLSAVVPLTNWWRFGDTAAAATMHAALWNGSRWDLHRTNRLAAAVVLQRLRRRASAARVLDAGCGWGGSIFFLEEARRQAALNGSLDAHQLVTYEGLTLSPTQARAARESASRGGLGDRVRFARASYEEALPAASYTAVLAIESIEHSSDLAGALHNLGGSLERGGVLIVVTDFLRRAGANLRLLTQYRLHWCGPHATWHPPANDARWEHLLRRAGLRVVQRVQLTQDLYHRPAWVLTIYFELLLFGHMVATTFGMKRLALQLSNQIGGVARELLLHAGVIDYVFMVAERAKAAPLRKLSRRGAIRHTLTKFRGSRE
ncbi:hypothetical protein AB1Y20_008462 [Prymnesium parvum]|uniref:Methyltransferase type 11 domain-containing protein n=1 Tax=Prymnesium parvum TaxID=97485 RepID=A0AB34IRJ1_PRYPA